MNNTRGLLITGYRSPSSHLNDDIESFYNSISQIIEHHQPGSLDFIIFVGDDNASTSSSSSYSRKAANCMLNLAEKYQMVDMISGIMTRGDKQPDSCFAYFNPDEVEIAVNILAGIGSDHEMLQIQVKKSEIVAEQPKFKKMVRRAQCVSNAELAVKLQECLQKWLDKWSIYDVEVSEKRVNRACNALIDAINCVQSFAFRKKTCWVHIKVRKPDSKHDIDILRLRALVSKYAWQIKKTER